MRKRLDGRNAAGVKEKNYPWSKEDEATYTVYSPVILYSQDYEQLRTDWTLNLCYKVDLKILNSAEYKDDLAYKSVLINAYTGEECVMWPGLAD